MMCGIRLGTVETVCRDIAWGKPDSRVRSSLNGIRCSDGTGVTLPCQLHMTLYLSGPF